MVPLVRPDHRRAGRRRAVGGRRERVLRVAEWILAAACAALGVRSLWTWSRRRFEGTDLTDHLLYALFLTGRIGLWFAFAGLFALYASSESVSAAERFRWYLMVIVVLSALQLVGGQLLGRR